MTARNIIAAREFVALVTTEPMPAIEALARSLDELALAYWDTSPGMPRGKPCELPEWSFTHASIGHRFPNLGLYGVTSPAEISSSVMVGDAIDDILDIARDLSEVIWRYDNLGADDAHWHFRFLFEHHWGEHLRDLARHLHATCFP